MCLHTILIDPNDNEPHLCRHLRRGRLPHATTAARRGGRATNGLKSNWELPDPDAEVGHCVHSIAMHPARPDVLFMQKHWDVMRSDDARR
ncbi:MAG: hypothetical protein V9G24_16140 [Rhodoblastus sp.]